MSRLARGGMRQTGPTMSFLWGYAAGYKRGRTASGIEARQRPDPAEGLDPKGESPVPERQTPTPPSETP